MVGYINTNKDYLQGQKWNSCSSTLNLTSALDGVRGQRHVPAALPRDRSGTYGIGGWVDPMTGLDGRGESRPYRDSISVPFKP